MMDGLFPENKFPEELSSPQVLYCGACATPIPPGEHFCPQCLAPASKAVPARPAVPSAEETPAVVPEPLPAEPAEEVGVGKTITCPKCAQENPYDTKRCAKCNVNLEWALEHPELFPRTTYQGQSITNDDFSDTLPRPFSQIPPLWLEVNRMTEGFFAQEVPRASGSAALISVLILGLVYVTPSAIYALMGAAPLVGGAVLLSAGIGLVVILVGFYVHSGLTYLGARIFGGSGDFTTQAYLQSLFVVPLGIVTLLLSLVTSVVGVGECISGIAEFALSIFGIVLNVRAIKVAHGLTTGRAVAAILVPVVLLVAAFLVLAIMGRRW